MTETIFLKLGGSLITDKDQAHTALLAQIDEIGTQIKRFVDKSPDTRLLIGHGSGSFGHIAANKYHTREGVQTSEEWQGFAEVWFEARALNQIVLERLQRIGLPILNFALSSAGTASNGQVTHWNHDPIRAALDHHLIPLIYGDVVFDLQIGGTILSTEEQFAYLVPFLKPNRILLAGLEKGVWQDYPVCTNLFTQITPHSYSQIQTKILGSISTDVTGGMASKVSSMLRLVAQFPSLQVRIFSGKEEGAIYRALSGEPIGTVLTAD